MSLRRSLSGMNVKGYTQHAGLRICPHIYSWLSLAATPWAFYTSKSNFWIWKHTSKCLLCWDWAGHCSPGTLPRWYRKHLCSSGPGTSPSDSVNTWSYSHCWSWHRRRTWAPHTWSGHSGYGIGYISQSETPSGDRRGVAVWCPVHTLERITYAHMHSSLTPKPHTHTIHEKSTFLKIMLMSWITFQLETKPMKHNQIVL